MLKCKRCGRILKHDIEKQNALGVVKYIKRSFLPKKIKVVRVDKLCDECMDEYNKFFIGDE